MFTPWLTPPDLPPREARDFDLGTRLQQLDASACRVALIGFEPGTADPVRRHLYDYGWDHGDLKLADLGNIRKQSTEFIIPLLRELYGAGILPVVIGANDRLLPTLYLAFAELNRQVGVCCIDSAIRLSAGPGTDPPAVLDPAVHRTSPPPFHLAHIGSQRHLVDRRVDPLFIRRHFERYSLGQSKADPVNLEPAIRDADLLTLDISAILAGEAPAQKGCYPSGFSLQEAGQLAYYAGNSDRLASFGIFGIDPQRQGLESSRLTEAAYAQIIWYFLLGVSRRSGDFPASSTGLVEYVVDNKLTDRVTFWRSPRSDRWWVQVPVTAVGREARNRLVACSYEDYLITSKDGKLPDRLLEAMSRY